MATVRLIAVIGAGLMGHGIALTFAKAGHAVSVYDPIPEALQTLHARVRQSLLFGLGIALVIVSLLMGFSLILYDPLLPLFLGRLKGWFASSSGEYTSLSYPPAPIS